MFTVICQVHILHVTKLLFFIIQQLSPIARPQSLSRTIGRIFIKRAITNSRANNTHVAKRSLLPREINFPGDMLKALRTSDFTFHPDEGPITISFILLLIQIILLGAKGEISRKHKKEITRWLFLSNFSQIVNVYLMSHSSLLGFIPFGN